MNRRSLLKLLAAVPAAVVAVKAAPKEPLKVHPSNFPGGSAFGNTKPGEVLHYDGYEWQMQAYRAGRSLELERQVRHQMAKERRRMNRLVEDWTIGGVKVDTLP